MRHERFLSKAIGIVTGAVTSGGSAAAGVDVVLTRCFNYGTAPTPPAGGAACAKIPGTQIQTSTDASGNYSFTNLDEGVYQVEAHPASIGLTTVTTPAAGQYIATIQLGAAATDTETVPDFVIS